MDLAESGAQKVLWAEPNNRAGRAKHVTKWNTNRIISKDPFIVYSFLSMFELAAKAAEIEMRSS